ncbi:MAG TPA: DUF4398 domain-containing protein [Usitatibacter sp.]|nr:DUF4398 domain-containing protein [Usitatibacter sp.]
MRPARNLIAAPLLVVAALVSGCASAPATEMSAARASIVEARALGVTASTSAEVQRAEAKLALSKRIAAAGEFGPARWLAEQAEIDAELAAARAATREALAAVARRQDAKAGLLKTAY